MPAAGGLTETALIPDDNVGEEASVGTKPLHTNDGLSKERHMSLYESLSARRIRLLRLLPGSYHDPLRCELRTVDLQFKPEYEAVSYTWAGENGDASRSWRLYVGKRHEILAITNNCANALRRLRYVHHSRDLWLDAVCINQDSNSERSHQVGIMRNIYAMANRVLVYLGEDPKDPEPETSVAWKYTVKGNTIELGEDLIKLSYLTRMWVIQEVASARCAWVLYGSRGARWEDFIRPPDVDAVDFQSKSAHGAYELLVNSHPWLQIAIQPKLRGVEELYELMIRTASCKATDPRDKVFALLGLLTGTQVPGLIPDYSLSRDQIFAGLTAFIFMETPGSLWYPFAMCGLVSKQAIPSWTIDWASLPQLPEVIPENPEVFIDWTSEAKEESERLYYDGPDKIRTPDIKDHVRFHRKGWLVMKGFSPYSLDECQLLPATSPPGVMTGIHFAPFIPAEERAAQLAATRWAQKDDKIFVVTGLPNHLLVLRPQASSTKYTYVGICDPPRLNFNTHLANYLNNQVILMVSAWNTVLANRDPGRWFDAEFWASIRKTCKNIKASYTAYATRCSTEPPEAFLKETEVYQKHSEDTNIDDVPFGVHPTRRPETILAMLGDLYDDLGHSSGISFPKGTWIRSLESPMIPFSISGVPVTSTYSKYLTYASWTWTRSQLSSKGLFNWAEPSWDLFRETLYPEFNVHMRAIFAGEIPAGFGAHHLLKMLLEYDLDTLSKGYRSLLGDFMEWQHLADLAGINSKVEGHAQLSWVLHEQLQLHSDPSEDYQNNSDDSSTWAEDFSHMWSRFRLHKSSEKSEQQTSSARKTESLGKDLHALWGNSRNGVEKAWGLLLDVVRGTEEHLLPLERLFVH
ncbi:Heterokaryon incompatibility protein 6, OR allele [Colletotrichum viniferum]|nr:Heterokaryon incompatibility protein 6, OR allele [Colletotrichum viniferum]